MQFVTLLLLFTAGVFFPLHGVPSWLRVIGHLNPATYGVDAMRRLFLRATVPAVPDGHDPLGVTLSGHTMGVLEDVLIIVVISIAVVGVAMWSFSTREGTLG
jgi:ABC-2 type transport system permease protein